MQYERSFNLLNSKFKELFIPTLLAAIAGNFAILADAFIVSILLGHMNLSVIQSMEPLVQFVNMVYWLIGFGGTILATSEKANFNEKKANYIFTLSLVTIIVISVLIMALGLLFPDSFLQILCNSAELKPLVYEYYKYYLLAIPFICFFIVLAYFAKIDDFVQLQFRAFLLANVLNVVFDIVFIEFFDMGIAGAALGMLLGYLIATVYLLTYFFNPKRTLKLIGIEFSKSIGYVVDICKTGYSSSSIALYQAIKLAIINYIILGVMANVGLVAFNMCCNTSLLVCIFIFGTAQSLLPIVTVYFQEKDYNGVEYVARRSLKIVIAFGVFFTALFALFPQTILIIFSISDSSNVPVVMNAVRIFSLSLLAYSINFLYIFYVQSIQNMKLANVLTLLNGLIFPVGFVLVFSILWKEDGIWLAFAASEIATLLVIYLYSIYRGKKTNGEYSGFFLKKHQDEKEEMLEYTINANKNDAVYLSRQVQEFLPDERMSVLVSLALEELLIYILEINDDLDWIDVIVRDNSKSTIISMKYSGIGYNPKNDKNIDSDNIRMLVSISDDIDYSQILGLNNTVIIINKDSNNLSNGN